MSQTPFTNEIRKYIELTARVGKADAQIAALKLRATRRLQPINEKIREVQATKEELFGLLGKLEIQQTEIDQAISAFDALNSQLTKEE